MSRNDYLQHRIALGVSRSMASKLYDVEAEQPRGRLDIKAADDGAAEIRIFEEIGLDYWTGEGMTAERFASLLDDIDASEIRVRINSPGGSVFDGITIYNLLAERDEPVTVSIDGIAASAASVIAMAGDEIEAAGNAQLMIHSAWTVAAGNAVQMREVADVLEKIDGQLADTYAARSGQPLDVIGELMSTDTYLTAAEAEALGLIDSIQPLKTGAKTPDPDAGVAGDRFATVRDMVTRERQNLAAAALRSRRAV